MVQMLDHLPAAALRVGEASQGRASSIFFFQAEDGIRDLTVTGVQTCALPISSKLQVLTFNLYFFPISCNFLHKDSVTSGSVLSSSVFVNLERRSFAYVPPGKGKPLLGTVSTPHTRFRVAEPSTLKCGLSVPRASRRRYFPAFLFTNPFRITTYARTSGGMVSSLRKLVLTITHLCILLPTCSTAQTHVPPQSSDQGEALLTAAKSLLDRKSTRLNSSHSQISYAVFCLKKKKRARHTPTTAASPHARSADNVREHTR